MSLSREKRMMHRLRMTTTMSGGVFRMYVLCMEARIKEKESGKNIGQRFHRAASRISSLSICSKWLA